MKKIISLLFVLTGMLIPVSRAAATYDYTITEATYYKDENIAEVTVNQNSSVTQGDVVVALYTEDDAFLSYSTLPVSFGIGTSSATIKVPFADDDTKAAKVKAMIWDSISTFKPICESKIGEVKESRPQAKYNADSDFAVAAANSNINAYSYVGGEGIYTLRVMKDGFVEAEELYISENVVVSYKDGSSYTTSAYATNLITKGSAFFYTTNAYGFVDRIDIVLNGQTSFDAYRDTALTTLVQTPDNVTEGIIDASDWYVNVNDSGLTANNKVVQLFVAPVMLSGDDYVVFSTMATDSKGDYLDTNIEYTYAVDDDANIYYYDMSPYAPTNYTAFSGGTFTGIDIFNTSYEGKAYIDDVAGEENFDGLLQVAFVMAVDGVVTNALVIGE